MLVQNGSDILGLILLEKQKDTIIVRLENEILKIRFDIDYNQQDGPLKILQDRRKFSCNSKNILVNEKLDLIVLLAADSQKADDDGKIIFLSLSDLQENDRIENVDLTMGWLIDTQSNKKKLYYHLRKKMIIRDDDDCFIKMAKGLGLMEAKIQVYDIDLKCHDQ